MDAGLAVILLTTLAYEKCDGAAMHAFVIDEFIAMNLTPFRSIAELFLSASLAKEVLWVHILSNRCIEVVFTTIVRLIALEAFVHRALFDKEIGWPLIVAISLCLHPIKSLDILGICDF